MTKRQGPEVGHHGTDATPDRGMKHGTPLQEIKMAGQESGYRYRYAKDKNIEDSLIVKGKETK